jgi:ATP-binding cassette, subfamily B, bacterial PglK
MNAFNTIWLILDTRQKIYFFFIFAFTFSVVLFEMLGLALLVPLISLIVNPDILEKYPLFYIYIKKISLITSLDLFITSLSLFFIIFTIRCILLSITIFYSNKYSYLTRVDTGQKILKYFIYQNFDEHLNTSSSIVISVIKNEVAQFGSALQSLISLLINIIISSSIFIFILFYYYQQLLITFFIVLIFSSLYFFFINKFILFLGSKRLFAEANFIKHLTEIFNSYKEIKIYNREQFFLKKFRENNLEICSIGYKWAFIQNLPKIWIELIFLVFLFLVIIFSYINGVSIKENITPLGVIIFGSLRILPTLAFINASLQNLKFNKASCEKIFSIVNKNVNIKNNIDILDFVKKIEIKNISFTYSNKKDKILRNLNFNINKGDIIGVSGHSGSGKTTFIEILMGFLHSYEGQILVDGKDIKTNYKAWQKNFSYVPQNIYLLDDTIKNNIVFGNEKIDSFKIYKILEKIGLSKFVNNLPNNIDTIVGENASLVSGGQAQRIAIARALYNDPKILVLDESTNSLDSNVENDILKYLKNFSDNITIIIISHNLKSLEICNKILKIE